MSVPVRAGPLETAFSGRYARAEYACRRARVVALDTWSTMEASQSIGGPLRTRRLQCQIDAFRCNSRTMIVTHTVDIAAPADLVWRVTCDVEKWPDWTPTVNSVRLLGEPGLRLGSVAVIRQPLQPPARWTVTEYVEGQRFAWMTQRRGLQLIGIHDLQATAGGTRNRLELHAAGPLATILWPLLRWLTSRALAAENAGVKTHCEQLAT